MPEKFDQGGATFPAVGKPTKKQLKDAIAADPKSVHLYSTSMFGGWSGPAQSLPENIGFNVVGPDPYTKRDWYATVEWKKGKLVVS